MLPRFLMKSILALVLFALCSSPLLAQYRCLVDGKSVITNLPCPASTSSPAPAPGDPKVLGDAENSAYASHFGAWRGEVQFMAKSGTAVISEAHAVEPFVIEIHPRGKVTGFGNGCTVKGIAAPWVGETVMTLDVTLSGCAYRGYNRQMRGQLALFKNQQYVKFSLQTFDMQRRPAGYYEIKGTLRR